MFGKKTKAIKVKLNIKIKYWNNCEIQYYSENDVVLINSCNSNVIQCHKYIILNDNYICVRYGDGTSAIYDNNLVKCDIKNVII